MRLSRDGINSFPLQEFHRFGVLCCRRLAHLTRDKRLAKALKMLERYMESASDERLRRDAHNAARSAYVELYRTRGHESAEVSVACTLVCATESFSNSNLVGNFEAALEKGEFLKTEAARAVTAELIEQVQASRNI